LRTNRFAQSFLSGAGPAAIGAIAGASIPLALGIAHVWQVFVLAGAAGAIIGLRRSVVLTLVCAGAVGAVGAVLGLPIGG
jgi:chromate transporter